MTSRLLTLILIVVVTVGLLFEAGRAVLMPEGRWQQWLQLLAAQQIADTLARQVQLGPVTGLTLSGVEARDLAIAEGRLLADGAMARAERLRLSFDLVGIMRGALAPAAAIDRVELARAWVHVVRDTRGELNLEKLLPKPVRPTPPEERFRGVVVITDSTAVYDDHALPTAHGGPLNLELASIDAEIDARRIGWTSVTATARERLGRFGALEVIGESETETGFAWGEVRLADVDVGWWYDALARTDGIAVNGGRAQIAATLGVPPEAGDEPPALSARVSMRGATVEVAALGDRPLDAEMDGLVTLGGAEIQHLEVTGAGLHIKASGRVGNFEDMVLDTSFEAEAAGAEDLLAPASEQAGLREQLAGLDVTGPVLASGRLEGPINNLNVSAQVKAPGEVRYADARLGEVVARAVEARVNVLNLLKPSLRAQVTLPEVEAADLTPLRALLPEELAGEPQIAPLADVQADVLWSADTPVAHTELNVPRAAVGDLEVADLRADLALAGDVLRVSDLVARPLGAELTAEGVVDLSEPAEPWAWARGEITGLDLARLPEVPGPGKVEGLGGAASARFAGSFESGKPQVFAQAVVEDGRLVHDGEEYGLQSLRGIVALDAESIRVAGATFADALGAGWVRGVVPFAGDLAASFEVAGVDLAAVQERFDLQADELRGQAFVAGDVRGSLTDPRIDITVRGFDLGMERWTLDGVIADLSGDAHALVIDNLYASSGRIIARAAGMLTAQGTPAGLVEALAARNYDLKGTVAVDGPMDERALALADLRDQDLHGAAHAEIEVGGTLKRPSARGTVNLGYAHYQTVATDDATLRVSLEGDVLELEEMRVPVGEALVRGQASITSLYDEPLLAATMTAEKVMLQDLAPFQELDLPLSGRLDLPYVSLNGPLDDLKGLAQIQASDLMLGGQSLGAVSAVAVLDGNTLQLPTTTLALAGGTISFGVGLQFEDGRVLVLGPSTEHPASEVRLSDVSVPELLRAGVPLAERFADPPPDELDEGERPLSKQLAALSLRLAGRLDATISAEGVIPSAPPEGTSAEDATRMILEALPAHADLTLRAASVDGRPLPDTMLSAQVSDDETVEVALESTEGEALITADGSWRPDGMIDALLDVSALDVAALGPWIPETVESIGGRLNLTVQAGNTLDNPRIMGSLDILEPQVHGAKFDIISAPIISYEAGLLRVDSLVIRERDEEMLIDGTLPFDWASMQVPRDRPLQLIAQTQNTELGIFPAILADVTTAGPEEDSPWAQVKATGTVDGKVTVAGTLARPELSGGIQVRAPSIETPWVSSPVEDLALDVTFAGAEGKTVVEELGLTARVESTTLEIGRSESVAAAPEAASSDSALADTAQVETANSPVAKLHAYDLARMHENVFHVRAFVSAPQQDFGDLTARKVRGTVSLDTSETGLQVLTISDLGANFGDGSVLLNGTVDISSFVPASFAENVFDVALVADGARPRYGNLFLGTVEGAIVGRNPEPGQPVEFSGGLTIAHAVMGVPRSEAGAGGELRGFPTSFPNPRFDLALGIGPDVRVKTAGISAPLQVNDRAVVLQGSAWYPEVHALIEAQQGEASIPGGLLNIEKGELRLLVAPALGIPGRTPPVLLRVDGSYEVIATQTIESAIINGREVGPININMAVNGTLPFQDYAKVQVSSDPPLSEEQILALVGMAPLSGGLFAEGSDLEDVLSEQFVSALGAAFRLYIFQPFEEELKELLGLSVFEVSFAFDQPVAVRIGDYLMEDLLITYRTAAVGGSEDYDLEISYRVDRRFEVGFATDERSNTRVFVGQTYRF